MKRHLASECIGRFFTTDLLSYDILVISQQLIRNNTKSNVLNCCDITDLRYKISYLCDNILTKFEGVVGWCEGAG